MKAATIIDRKAKTTSVSFSYSTEKTVQAVAVLLQTNKTPRMGYCRLLKLLYIADRESLEETGHPIIGGRLVAMDKGPLHSRVYSLANRTTKDARWSAYIGLQEDGHTLVLNKDPGVLELSRYEIRKLREVAHKYRTLSDAFLHSFPEWKKNHKPGSSATIPLEDVIDGVNRTADKEAILEEARAKAYFDSLYGY